MYIIIKASNPEPWRFSLYTADILPFITLAGIYKRKYTAALQISEKRIALFCDSRTVLKTNKHLYPLKMD